MLLTRETDQKAIRDQIDKLEAEFGKAAYRETMSLAAAMTQDDPDASVLVFTDEQWSERADDIVFAAPVEIVSLKGEGTSNAAVEQFGIKMTVITALEWRLFGITVQGRLKPA